MFVYVLKGLLISLSAFVFLGCTIHYKKLNDTQQHIVQNHKVHQLSYRVDDLPILATTQGLKAIDDTLKASKLFKDAEKHFDDSIPLKGLYIHIEPSYKAPTIAAAGFGYLSLITFTLLPAWSNHDGYRVTYSVYNNGSLIKTLQYEKERFIAIWLPILPFSWINLFTDGEYEVFTSTTNEFLNDIEPTLREI